MGLVWATVFVASAVASLVGFCKLPFGGRRLKRIGLLAGGLLGVTIGASGISAAKYAEAQQGITDPAAWKFKSATIEATRVQFNQPNVAELEAAVEACVKKAVGFMPVGRRIDDRVEYVVATKAESAEHRCTHRDGSWSFRVRATKEMGSLEAAITIADSAAKYFWSDQSGKAVPALKKCAAKAPTEAWHWYETGGAVAISCGRVNGLLVLRVHKSDGVDAVLARNFGEFHK